MILFGATLVETAVAQTPKRPVTVQDLSSPLARFDVPEPIWRPDGKAFAYEEDGKLWLYEVATRRASVWLSLSDLRGRGRAEESNSPEPFGWQNRRVDRARPQWFPDGRRLLVPTTSGLAIVETGERKRHQWITEITSQNVPVLAPDGGAILFRRNENLYIYNIASRRAAQLTSDGTATLMNGQLDWVYPEELDLGKAAWWSPDSKQIAYMQFNVADEFVYPHEDLIPVRAIFEPQRYPQAGTPNARVRVGIVSAQGGNTRWLDLRGDATALTARVEWLPDSNSIAVERLSRVQNRLDLLVGDCSSGKMRTVLTEHDKTWINTSDDLHFLKNQTQFIWSSERTGFRHLYLYSLKGELVKQLTAGDWQVNKVEVLDQEHGRVYYTSSEASPLEDQLYAVPLEGGERQRISQGSGMHAIKMAPNGGYYTDTFSNLGTPSEATLHDANGTQLAVIKTLDRTELDKLNLLSAEIVTVRTSDGTPLYARLIKPAGFDPAKKYPAIVFVYGGPQAQSVHNAWPGISWEQVLANRGFVIWQLDNRGSYGRGHAFESPVYRELGKTELADQRTGVEKLIGMGFVDKNRIGIYGWSFGGYMTIYSLLRAPDLFTVGVAGAPVTDWHNYDTIYTERYMGLPSENVEGYRNSSNVLTASKLKGKLLIVCNFEDDNVLFQNTMQMMTALHHANKEFEFMLYPQKTHGVTGELSEGMHQQMTDFFVENLHP